jgi:hypothetical protein
MGSNGVDADTGKARVLVRVLVLLAVIGIAVLLTRCPIADNPDRTVPPPLQAR